MWRFFEDTETAKDLRKRWEQLVSGNKLVPDFLEEATIDIVVTWLRKSMRHRTSEKGFEYFEGLIRGKDQRQRVEVLAPLAGMHIDVIGSYYADCVVERYSVRSKLVKQVYQAQFVAELLPGKVEARGEVVKTLKRKIQLLILDEESTDSPKKLKLQKAPVQRQPEIIDLVDVPPLSSKYAAVITVKEILAGHPNQWTCCREHAIVAGADKVTEEMSKYVRAWKLKLWYEKTECTQRGSIEHLAIIDRYELKEKTAREANRKQTAKWKSLNQGKLMVDPWRDCCDVHFADNGRTREEQLLYLKEVQLCLNQFPPDITTLMLPFLKQSALTPIYINTVLTLEAETQASVTHVKESRYGVYAMQNSKCRIIEKPLTNYTRLYLVLPDFLEMITITDENGLWPCHVHAVPQVDRVSGPGGVRLRKNHCPPHAEGDVVYRVRMACGGQCLQSVYKLQLSTRFHTALYYIVGKVKDRRRERKAQAVWDMCQLKQRPIGWPGRQNV